MNEHSELKADVQNLNERLNDVEQTSRLNNIEVQGIPERANENLVDILKKIGDKIHLEIDPNQIDYIHRTQLNANSKTKIKNIIVRFTRRQMKENFLASVKNLRATTGSPKLLLEGLSDAVYVNEHLTLNNKLLYRDARQAARDKHYRFVWTKNGSIFVRKDETSRIMLIKNNVSIENM
nr:unnamed protein product [Callosobruchus chinensis]